ncbi:MAG TPA: hypothetical protein VFX51_12065 [Solirubrobacteraceae bacterium]|nr:hypothetical protein [Solirubrobacteraceae bacterium]
MQPRTILISVGVAIVAFAAAFGIGKATSGSDASTGGTGTTAQAFDQPTATINAKAPKAGLPALKPKPTPEPTATPAATATAAPTATATPISGGGQTPVTGGGQSPVTGGGETPVSGGGG